MQRILRDQARKFALDWREESQLRVQPISLNRIR